MNNTKKITAAAAALAGLGAIAFGTTLPQPAIAQGPPPPPFAGRPHGGERHPELRRALARRWSGPRRNCAGRPATSAGTARSAADLCHQARKRDPAGAPSTTRISGNGS